MRVALPKRGKRTCLEQAPANDEPQKQYHVSRSYESNTDLNLSIAGEVAGHAVQITVETWAGVLPMEEQFFKTVSGQYPPEMIDGSFSYRLWMETKCEC